MPVAQLSDLNGPMTNIFTERAGQYLILAHRSAGEALAAMHSLRSARRGASGRGPSGRTSDQDQDLLRAMLVFACAGLDASMKALVEDALPTLFDRRSVSQEQLDTFATRHLGQGSGDASRTALMLAHPVSPRQALIEAYVRDLTGSSLQSVEELHKVRAALGIKGGELESSITALRESFIARNEVGHEMDLMPTRSGRTRRHRGITDMIAKSNGILEVGAALVSAVSAMMEASIDGA
jgi:hypothetical protein